MRKANNSTNKECHYRYGLPFSLHILKYAYKVFQIYTQEV